MYDPCTPLIIAYNSACAMAVLISVSLLYNSNDAHGKLMHSNQIDIVPDTQIWVTFYYLLSKRKAREIVRFRVLTPFISNSIR
jgi:hypothetical protein